MSSIDDLVGDDRRIRLLGTDLDGTLLIQDEIPEENKEAFARYLEEERDAVVMSARPPSSIDEKLDEAQLTQYLAENLHISAFNGAYNRLRENVATDETLSTSIYDVLQNASRQEMNSARFTRSKVTVDEMDAWMETYQAKTGYRMEEQELQGDPLYMVEIAVPPATFPERMSEEEQQEQLEDMLEVKSEDMTVNYLHIPFDDIQGHWLQLTPKTDKGEAVATFRTELGIPARATMYIGDGRNDLEAITAAGTGVAMQSMPQSVRDDIPRITTVSSFAQAVRAATNYK